MPDPQQFRILGYALDWWVTAVIVPGFLGVRWWLAHRRSQTETLIQQQSDALAQITQLNAGLVAQVADLVRSKNEESAQLRSVIDRLEGQLVDERRRAENATYERDHISHS